MRLGLRFLRNLLIVTAAIAGAILVRYLWPVPAAERAAWSSDLDRLEAHTAAAYANLGDRLASRRLSPRELDARARAALEKAHTRGEARAALVAFVEAFDDRHFVASAPYSAPRKWLRRILGKDRKSESGPIPWTAPGDAACAHFGVRDRGHQKMGKVDWNALAGFMPLSADPVSHPFPAGLLARAGRPPLGILRIGLFSQQAFPQLCAAEWERFKSSNSTAEACDDACRDDFWDSLEERLLDRFAAELGELAAGGAAVLLVDLTDNGGGSGIVSRMVRMVTSRPLAERAFGFIRHPHSVTRLTSLAADYAVEAARPDLPPRQRELYGRMRARAEAASLEAATPCDLSQVWTLASSAELPCSNVGRSEPWLDAAEESELAQLERLREDTASAPRAAAWNGELYVLTNRRTASASEDFAASLQDAGAARIVGETTMGVGCGYTDGGVTLELPATGLTVQAPDCIRYRGDRGGGRNEAEGVLPDLPVAWSDGDSGKARAEKVLAALPR